MSELLALAGLIALAERCEQATGPDRELDAAIYNAIPDGPNRKAERLQMERWTDRFDDGWRTMWTDRDDKYCEPLKRYTASIDAALTLVPEDFWLEHLREVSGGKWAAELIERTSDPEWGICDAAATPALALCAAALRARASQTGGGDNG